MKSSVVSGGEINWEHSRAIVLCSLSNKGLFSFYLIPPAVTVNFLQSFVCAGHDQERVEDKADAPYALTSVTCDE